MRFTLLPNKWYACEIIGDEFDDDLCSYSPIRVNHVRLLKAGNRSLELGFYHANYPEGVRDKVYILQTIERCQRFLLARSNDHDPVRLLKLYDIDWSWAKRHLHISPVPNMSVEAWLDRNA